MPLVKPLRSFIAVELDRKTKRSLRAIQDELKKSGPDAKWVGPDNIHLTLKFLGDVPAEKIGPVAELLSRLFDGARSFSAPLDRIGCFPEKGSPRVLWAGLADQDQTAEILAKPLERELEKMGWEKEKRRFQPHMTLARLRSDRNKIALLEQICRVNKALSPEHVRLDNVTLFESRLGPQGPDYSIIRQIKLI